jgi:hypothetical protein
VSVLVLVATTYFPLSFLAPVIKLVVDDFMNGLVGNDCVLISGFVGGLSFLKLFFF